MKLLEKLYNPQLINIQTSIKRLSILKYNPDLKDKSHFNPC